MVTLIVASLLEHRIRSLYSASSIYHKGRKFGEEVSSEPLEHKFSHLVDVWLTEGRDIMEDRSMTSESSQATHFSMSSVSAERSCILNLDEVSQDID